MIVFSAFRRPMVVGAVCALTLALVVLLGVHWMAPATSAPTEPPNTSATNYTVETADDHPSSLEKVVAKTNSNEFPQPSGADAYAEPEDLLSPVSASDSSNHARQPAKDLNIPQPPSEEGGAHTGLRVAVDVVLVLAVAALGFLLWWKQRIWEESNEKTLESLNRTLESNNRILEFSKRTSEESREQHRTLSKYVKLLHDHMKLILDQLKARTPVESDAWEGRAARQTSTDGFYDGLGEAQMGGVQRGRTDPPEAPQLSLEYVCKALQDAAAEALSQYPAQSSATFTESVLAKLQPEVIKQLGPFEVRARKSSNLVEAYDRPVFISVVFAEGNGWLLPHRGAQYAYSIDTYYMGGEACWPNVKVPAKCRLEPGGGVQLTDLGTLG